MEILADFDPAAMALNTIDVLGGANGIWIIGAFFFTMVALERLWYWRFRPASYDSNDGWTNIALNLMNSIFSLFIGVLVPLSLYIWAFENFRFFDFSTSLWGLAIAFIGHDLVYYTEHRLGHRVGLFWAFHQVHHSSNEFNYTVAARGCWFDGFMKRFLALPLALIGVSPVQYFGMEIAKNMFGIWNHSRHIPKLGFLENILATPSNHRVHHGAQPHYIDKNYSQVLIIWDKLLGTYQREDEAPRYGLVKPFHSYNPLMAQVHGIGWLMERMNAADNWRDKLRYLWKPPEWSHDGRCPECPKYASLAPAE